MTVLLYSSAGVTESTSPWCLESSTPRFNYGNGGASFRACADLASWHLQQTPAGECRESLSENVGQQCSSQFDGAQRGCGLKGLFETRDVIDGMVSLTHTGNEYMSQAFHPRPRTTLPSS
jgi:hypothetical protein